MIGNGLGSYLFIRPTVILLRLITPLSIIYCGIRLAKPRLAILPFAVEIIAYAETAFYFLIYLPRRYVLQKPAPEGTSLSQQQRNELFNKCLKAIPSMDHYLSVWFRGADPSDLKRGDIKEWLSWAFFNQSKASNCDEDELDKYVSRIETQLKYHFPPGRSSHKSMRPTIDPINIQHRSLLWYLVAVGGTDTVCFLQMLRLGFQHYRLPMSGLFSLFPFRFLAPFSRHVTPAKQLSYWYRPHTSTTRLPVLFIHGIGIGLQTYTNFLQDIIEKDAETAEDGQIGVIALEIMPISFRITHTPLQRDEEVAQILQILEEHHWEKLVLVSHSYGTIIATHLLENALTRARVGPLVLVDPVAISLHSGDVAYNFAYRSPRKASEHQLHYFACTDMGVAHTVTRRFMWTENALWKEDLDGRKVTVVLAGEDIIVDTEALGLYLAHSEEENWKEREWTGKGSDILWYEHLNHAQVFDSKKDRKALIAATMTYCQKPEALISV